MFGLEFVTVGLLHLAALDEKPQIQCKAKMIPKISVIANKSNVQYDFTKTKNEMSRFDIGTLSPYAPHHTVHIKGVMNANIRSEQWSDFVRETYEHADTGCLYIKKIEIKVDVDSTIYVAKEHPEGSCEHKEILKHEKKHLREDQLVINKYSKLVKDDLDGFVQKTKGSFGPYKISELSKVEKNLRQQIADLVTARHDKMNVERQERQQAIDSIEEYDAIAAACPKSQ